MAIAIILARKPRITPMRVSKAKSAENRARILEEASRLFRERGFAGVGVDALTEAAGLTHGSLYSRFGSKERLAAEAIAAAQAGSAERLVPEDPPATLEQVVRRYLSRSHRDSPGGGCALAALGSEVARQGEPVRAAYTDALRRLSDRLDALLPVEAPEAKQDAALAAIATLVGALILARAVDDEALSDRILRASREELTTRFAGQGPARQS